MALIKICGITDEKEIAYINEAMPDFCGFVMYFPKSKRNITIEKASLLKNSLAAGIKSVAVTVKPTIEQIEAIAKNGFDFIQIHGEIEESIYDNISLPVIKAFNVNDLQSIDKYLNLDIVKGFVFDAGTPGSGQTFDWNILKELDTKGKFTLIAGGINCDNVISALEQTGLSGADTSSGVENDNGIGKSEDKIKRFVGLVRAHEEM